MKFLDTLSIILLLLAGLTWGTVGIADFNAIMWVFIAMPKIQHALYILFGLAAIWRIVFYKGIRRRCCPCSGSCSCCK